MTEQTFTDDEVHRECGTAETPVTPKTQLAFSATASYKRIGKDQWIQLSKDGDEG